MITHYLAPVTAALASSASLRRLLLPLLTLLLRHAAPAAAATVASTHSRPTAQIDLAAATAAAHDSSTNLVQNPDFADASAAAPGGALHWSGPGVAFARTELPDGSTAMHWNNSDPAGYYLCEQPLPLASLTPGALYTLTADVRTLAVEGSDSGATVCVQWSGAQGFIGGFYPPGVSGTQADWKSVGATFAMPLLDGGGGGGGNGPVTDVTVSVYTRQGGVGQAWWRNVSVVALPPLPLAVVPVVLSPGYRGRITTTADSNNRQVDGGGATATATADTTAPIRVLATTNCCRDQHCSPYCSCEPLCRPVTSGAGVGAGAAAAAAGEGAMLVGVVATLVERATGRVVETAELAALPAGNLTGIVQFRQDPAALVPGEYVVNVSLVNRSSSATVFRNHNDDGNNNDNSDNSADGNDDIVMATATANLTRVNDSAPAPTVYVDVVGRLVVRGAPFFPIGMYTSSMAEADYQRFGATGGAFNTIMSYQAQNATQMDWAHAHNIMVAYTIKDDYCGHALPCTGNASARSAQEEAVVRGKIEAFRGHPAMLMWYINDELGLDMQSSLTEHQRWCEELDPDHPTWAVLYEVEDMTGYLHTCDIIGSDPYPVGRALPNSNFTTSNLSLVRDWAQTTRRLTFGARPLVEVIQAHNARNYHPTCADCTTPTPAQSRSMVWQAVAAGANGILFYSYFDIQRNPDVPFEAKWTSLVRQAEELRALAPLLISDEGPAPPVRLTDATGAAPGWMMQRSRWVPGNSSDGGGRGGDGADAAARDYVLFAVGDGNTSTPHTAASFSLDPGALAPGQRVTAVRTIGTVLAEERVLRPWANGTGWDDAFWAANGSAWEVVAYRVVLSSSSEEEEEAVA